ncbi:hypothetical protein ADK61_33475 [Streptomyces sp. XY66]|nr:hypothetical protein ADK61_33475 [Streptomyces sp. XY66]
MAGEARCGDRHQPRTVVLAGKDAARVQDDGRLRRGRSGLVLRGRIQGLPQFFGVRGVLGGAQPGGRREGMAPGGDEESLGVAVSVAGGIGDQEADVVGFLVGAGGEDREPEHRARVAGLGGCAQAVGGPVELVSREGLGAHSVVGVGELSFGSGQPVLVGERPEGALGAVPVVGRPGDLGHQVREPGRDHRLRAPSPVRVVVASMRRRKHSAACRS